MSKDELLEIVDEVVGLGKLTDDAYSVAFWEGLQEYLLTDTISVVRCKDCKWFLQPGQYTKEPFGLCYIRGAMAVTANDYCSCGERKTE